MENRGALSYSLGVHFALDIPGGVIKIDLNSYKLKLLESAGMIGCRTATTPLPPGLQMKAFKEDLTLAEAKARGNYPYEQFQGCLNWIAMWDPTIAYAVSQTARHVPGPWPDGSKCR